MTNKIESWWDVNSAKYQEDSRIPTRSVHYGPYAPFEDQLALLGDVKGKNILEIGCGGGQCSIAFAKHGANCIGLDISKKQLEFARNLAKKENVDVKFIRDSFNNLKKINTGSQDIVFSAFALQYAPSLGRVFVEVRRVLKEKGVFVFSQDHPFYSIFDAEAPKISSGYFRIKHSYFKTGKFTESWPDGSKRTWTIYKRKLSDIYSELFSSGFDVEQIVEPFDPTQYLWREIFPMELCERVGATIIFKSRKK